ncbi:hypothetical protein DVA86_31045 [Streptomyces armeniacus]|uniref:Uncharacterized protein n=1 Tax=Streptomyces armeniacus TaxID=83291 RepID=A0A345XXJ8_9ACTN|nr:hypothetical protein [Streptomyces armeniacus]AXK36364.1 hypothetical protein DVA86_31045 [Streptomyces armeniacus]
MTVPRLVFADFGEAAGLAAFLGRLLRWEKGAAVRLQAGDSVLGVFARPARFEVLAVVTARLLEPVELDATVSAGELLEGVDEASESVRVPAAVTGPSWAGLLPPRGGWQARAELRPGTVREAATGVIAEFRERTDRLAPEERTRATLDDLAEEIWRRQLNGTGLPLRAVHAAHALGFLRDESAPVALYGTGPWLRLRTAYGSVIARGGDGGRAAGAGLSVTPV